MSAFPQVSIVFPNYNGGKEPLECLKSIQELNYPRHRIETIVVDNHSTDGSDLEIKKKFPKVKLIKNKQNLGFAKAMNQGIKKASGYYIFITNDDIVFEKNSLKNLVVYSQKNPNVGIIGGKIFYKVRANQISSAGYQLNRWTGSVKIAKNPNQAKEPDWVQGCAMLIPKSVFEKIGLFDSGFIHLFEDVDFCFRVRSSGLKIVYLPDSKFWHGESITADKNKPNKYFHWYRSKFRFFLKNMPIWNILSIILIQMLLVTPYRALILKDGRFWPFLKGFWWNLRNITKTLALRKSLKI